MTAADLAFWLLPWQRSLPLSLGFALVAFAYIRGSWRRRNSPRQQALFWTGFGLNYLVLQTGLDYFAEHLFWAHRLQHLVLHHIAPVVIALSMPGNVIGAALPLRRVSGLARPLAWLNHPAVAPMLFSALICLWLLPPIHTVAMLDSHLYDVMNLSMVFNGVMFWHAVLNGGASSVIRMLMALAVMPVQIALGLILVSAGTDLYPVYDLCGRAGALSAVADQQLGGLILWWPGAALSVVVVVLLAWGMFRVKAPEKSLPFAAPDAPR